MVRVVFTHHLKRHISCPDKTVTADTLKEALSEAFRGNDQLRTYIVDER